MISVTRKKGDVIVVKIYDEYKNVCYKDKANLSDKKQVARIFMNIQEKFGLDISRLVEEYVISLKQSGARTIWE